MTQVIIEVSARHCHLSQKHLDKLFSKGYQLKKIKDLSQGGEYAAMETVVFKTKDGEIDNLRILGPIRKETQVELSMTDARKVGLKPPVRLSGDLDGSAGGVLIGPKGQVKLSQGVIIAERHIHCDPATAKKLKLTEKSRLAVKTPGERSVTFYNIPVRIKDSYVWRMHIDTDEGNASLPDGVCSKGEIIK